MIAPKKGFVCQNCGKTVPPKTERCPHCGRFFKGVRCPQCLYIGEADDFLNGCPSCGYLGSTAQKAGDVPDFLTPEKNRPPKKELPAWFYFVSLGFLVTAIIILFIIFLNMQ